MAVPTATDGGQLATAIGAFQDDILDYSAAVGQTAAGGFTNLICENDEVSVGAGATAPVPIDRTTAGTPACGQESGAL